MLKTRRKSFISSNHFVRLYDNFDDCVVVLVSMEWTEFKEDVIITCVYVTPKRSPIFETLNTDGIQILNERLMLIMSDFSIAFYIIVDDCNVRIGNLQDVIPNDDLDHVFGENDYPTDEFNSPKCNKGIRKKHSL